MSSPGKRLKKLKEFPGMVTKRLQSHKEEKKMGRCNPLIIKGFMAGWTGIEPATSGLTGQRSNRAELPPHKRR